MALGERVEYEMRVVELDQRTDEWLTWRRQGITATEAGAIAGHSDYCTPWRVWAEKTGRVEPDDLSKVPAVIYGIEHEDEVRNLFMLETGDVAFPACGEWDENPVFRASFDGLTSSGCPVEIKCPSDSTIIDLLAKGEESEVYKRYQWQIHWQMLVADAPKAFLVFYLGNEKIKVYEIARNEEMINELKTACKSFWENNILKDKAPLKIPERDTYVPQGDDLIEWAKAARDYKAIKDEIDRLNKLLDEPKERLLNLMGNYRNADFFGVSVTNTLSKGSVDYKSILAKRGIVLTPEELELARRESKPVKRVTITDRDLPKGIVPEKNEDLCEAVKAMHEDFTNLCW